jgi:chemotaxis signal transduction protein
MSSANQKVDIDALKAQIDAEIATRPQVKSSIQTIDIDALKAQIDAEIAARLLLEADYARYIHRRGVHVGNLRLLVNLDATSEVAEMPPLFRLPGAPAGVRGLANRHGRVVPVVDISVLYGTKRDFEEKVWLLVCGRGDEAVGLVVDSLPERKKFAVDDEIGISEISHPIAPYARAVYREGQDVWIDLDTEAFFSSVFQADHLHV